MPQHILFIPVERGKFLIVPRHILFISVEFHIVCCCCITQFSCQDNTYCSFFYSIVSMTIFSLTPRRHRLSGIYFVFYRFLNQLLAALNVERLFRLNCCCYQNAECSTYCYLNVHSMLLNATFIACIYLFHRILQPHFEALLRFQNALLHSQVYKNVSVSNFSLGSGKRHCSQCE